MSIGAAGVHLIGGGADSHNAADLVAGFAVEALSHAAGMNRAPRLALVMVDTDGRAESFRPAYVDPLNAHVHGGFEYVDLRLDGGPCQSGATLREVDGIVVAGGPTQDYHSGLYHLSGEIKSTLADRVPYLGFSAGALIAAQTSVLGGWQDAGRKVCDEDWSEGLNELTLAPGLGIIDFTVDVHATEGGLLTRAAAAALRPECDLVAAIDENTVVSLPFGSEPSEATVSGDGFVWWFATSTSGIVATRQSAN